MPGPTGAPRCPLCKERVFYNEEKSHMGSSWHKTCFKCSECHKRLESGLANLHGEAEDLYCNTCYRRNFAPPRDGAMSPTALVDHDDPECCPRCGRKVYFAEQIMGLGRKWHDTCFSCAKCNKKLEGHLAADHDNEMYCKSCYGRNFGPKGYGYAGGAGTGLSNEAPHPDNTDGLVSPVTSKVADMSLREKCTSPTNDGNPPRWGGGGGDHCSRCSGAVYIAERRAACGKSFHDKCFNCHNCQKKLDSSMLAEREGEIYCKVCYGKNFGPRGYGYGQGAGALQMAN